jgi:hypothetical protein
MNADAVYIVPDTLPKDGMLFPLVQCFNHAVYIAPVENELPEELPPLAEELLAQGVLRWHCPAPLGADRERFLRLISELRQRPGEHISLTLAGTGGREEESQNGIISAVRRQAAGGRTGTTQADALWQARLVLKLAEIAEQQEEEVRQSLRRITLREQELFSRLRDADSPFCPHTEAASSSPADDSRRMRLRLKAWRTLLACSTEPPPATVFITADRETFDSLMEEGGGDAQSLLTLPLPAVPAACNVAEKREMFHRDAATLLSGLLRHPADFPAEEWNRLLDAHYPAAEHGRCRLSLYSLPESAAHVLFSGKQGTIIGMLEQHVPDETTRQWAKGLIEEISPS